MLSSFLRKCVDKLQYEKAKFINRRRLNKSKQAIRQLKDIHNGKRCFIVGNGPSLLVEDLEKLKGEICFGTHRIYQIFDETSWRPQYYCAQDRTLITNSKDDISNIQGSNKWIAILENLKNLKIKHANYIQLHFEEFYPELPKFSEDLNFGIYEGMTVSYMCLQMAVYMGFKEIYLLGIDHSYSQTLMPDGTIQVDKSIKDHFSSEDITENIPQTFKATLAYQAAKEYAKKHNVKIYNATRGGQLEVYERVVFETLF